MRRSSLVVPIRWTITVLVCCGLVAGCATTTPATPTVVMPNPTPSASALPSPTLAATSLALPATSTAPARRATPAAPVVVVPGAPAQGDSSGARISADGRCVAFASNAANLVPGDTNGEWDVFVHDRTTGETELVSVATDGAEAEGASGNPAISADGRWVAFDSAAANLVPGDINNAGDVFVQDRETGRTELVSAGLNSAPANGASSHPAISGDGRYVTFSSQASNLVAGVGPGKGAAYYVFDRESRTMQRAEAPEAGREVSAGGRWAVYPALSEYPPFAFGIYLYDRDQGMSWQVTSGHCVQPDDDSAGPSISADGRYISYTSLAQNLVRGLATGGSGVYVFDRATGRTERVDVASATPDQRKETWTNEVWARVRAALPPEVPIYRPAYVPERFGSPDLIEVRQDSQRGSYTVLYWAEGESLVCILNQGACTWGNSAEPATREPVTVHGDVRGELVTTLGSPQVAVYWQEQGQAYAVKAYTSQVTRDELLRFAQSIVAVR